MLNGKSYIDILNYLLIVSQRVYSDTGIVSQLMTSCNYSVCEALL